MSRLEVLHYTLYQPGWIGLRQEGTETEQKIEVP